MAKNGGTKGWVATAGVALLLTFVALSALTGAASAAPVPSAVPTDSPAQWAYGGEGWFNGSFQSGLGNLTWTSEFGWTVVFTVTAEGTGVWMVEEQRTVGVTIAATFTGKNSTIAYNYHASETDTGFANVTNQSVVYVNGQPVPALGVSNASAAISASIAESISRTFGGHTASASLNVQANGQASTSFSPSLGLVPLNLTGVTMWNSSATATPAASWTVSYSWSDQGYNGTTASGSGSKSGSLSGTGTVSLTGYKVQRPNPVFRDGKSRTAVYLEVQGVFDNYDGFLWIPHAFDIFGTAVHPYDAVSFGSAGISGETLYLSSGGPGGLGVTAAATTFGADDTSVNALASPVSETAPTASSASPGGTVVGQPMSVAQANAEANCLKNGCGGAAASPGLFGGMLVALVGVAVAVVVGTVGVIEWRSYARRKSRKGLVGGYGESWPNGVPPASAVAPPTVGPSGGVNPPEGPEFKP